MCVSPLGTSMSSFLVWLAQQIQINLREVKSGASKQWYLLDIPDTFNSGKRNKSGLQATYKLSMCVSILHFYVFFLFLFVCFMKLNLSTSAERVYAFKEFRMFCLFCYRWTSETWQIVLPGWTFFKIYTALPRQFCFCNWSNFAVKYVKNTILEKVFLFEFSKAKVFIKTPCPLLFGLFSSTSLLLILFQLLS